MVPSTDEGLPFLYEVINLSSQDRGRANTGPLRLTDLCHGEED